MQTLTIEIDLSKDSQQNLNELFSILPEEFFLKKLDFKSDTYISDSEKSYLLGFKEESCVTKQTLINTCSYFKIKNKFSIIKLNFTVIENEYCLLMETIGLWTFNKVVIKGLMRNAEKYKQLYLMEYGEPFNINKHHHSIEKIKEIFQEEGFFNAKIYDYLQYDATTKAVLVTLVIEKEHQFTIQDVIITIQAEDIKLNQLLLKKLQRLFTPRLKKNYYHQSLINNETQFLKQYLAKKGFLNSIIKLGKEFDYNNSMVKLNFHLTLNQKKTISFFGNHFYSNKELFDLFFAFGRSAALLPNSFICQEIIGAYQKKGFWNIEVNSKEEKNRTFFLINEGQRSTITAVEVEGAPHSNQSVLKNAIRQVKKEPFDEEVVRIALQKIVNAYLKEGFFDIKIQKQEYIPTEESGCYKLLLIFNEGIQRFIEKVTIDQFPELIDQGPFALITAQQTMPFDINQIQVQRQWLIDYFHKQGFLYVEPAHTLTYEGNKAAISWHVDGIQQKVTFGKTIILGVTKFPFEYIRRELAFNEGDLWQKEKLEKSLDQLRRLGIFESIYIYPYNISQREQEKTIIIKVQEDDPFEVRFRMGFQQVSKTLLEFRKGTTYKIGSTFLYKNPFNVADRFSIDLDFTRFYRNVSIEYKRPWFFSLPINTVLKGYSNKYIQPVVMGSDKRLYQAVQQGFLISINQCCNYLNYGCNLGLEIMETNDLSLEMARAINFITSLVDKQVPYLYTEPNLVVDYLDNDVNPSYGSLSVISCKIMVPLRSISTTYFKCLLEQVVFFPIRFLWSTVGIRFKLGHIFNREFSNIMPPDRFF